MLIPQICQGSIPASRAPNRHDSTVRIAKTISAWFSPLGSVRPHGASSPGPLTWTCISLHTRHHCSGVSVCALGTTEHHSPCRANPRDNTHPFALPASTSYELLCLVDRRLDLLFSKLSRAAMISESMQSPSRYVYLLLFKSGSVI